MKLVSLPLLFLAVFGAGLAVAQAPRTTELPPECRERNVNPEKCVLNDGPPPPPIVRKKKPLSPPPATPKPPASQESSGARDGGTRR